MLTEQLSAKTVRTHPRLDALLLGEWHIEADFGLRTLGSYLADLDLLEAGAKTEDVTFRRRRDNMTPRILSAAQQQSTVPIWKAGMEDKTPPGSILMLNLVGAMYANGTACAWGMDEYEEAIRAANHNRNIEGILIRANTGGGEALAGQILNNAVRDSQKAVVVYADFLASAGVHGTLHADEIIASGDASRIGSIGVMVSIDKETVKWYQENVEDIYADHSPNKNREWREYLAGNTSPLKAALNQNAAIFRAEVQAARPLKGNVEETLSGDVFYAKDAKRRGLIDGIGTFEYAMTRLQANIRRRKKM